MAYKPAKSCADCKFYIPDKSIMLIGECSFHKIIVNILLSCYNYGNSNNNINIENLDLDSKLCNNKSCGICEIQFNNVSIIGFNEFIKENKYKIRIIDSCNNCKYYKYSENLIFKGNCTVENLEVDILHLCEKHINAPQRVYILHPADKSEW